MADASQVLAGVRVDPRVTLSVLTPNLKGLEGALEASKKMQSGKKHLEVGEWGWVGLYKVRATQPFCQLRKQSLPPHPRPSREKTPTVRSAKALNGLRI